MGFKESLTSRFTKAILEDKKLAERFKLAFLRNRAVRLVFRHAEKVTPWMYIAGNVTLAAKNGLHLNLEGASGLAFVGASAALRFARKYPVAAFKTAGLMTALGAGLLAASGVSSGQGQSTDWYKAVSPLVAFMPTAALLGFQNGIAKVAERMESSRYPLARAFGRVAKYPVVLGALLDTAGSVGLLKSRADMIVKMIAVDWIGADFGLAATDPRAQDAYKKANGKGPPPAANLRRP